MVSAIRYTFVETSQTFDDVFSPLLVDFLSLMADDNIVCRILCIYVCLILTLLDYQVVRRLSLSTLNSAARTKPHLIRGHLTALLPNLYKETLVNPSLIRTVQMGPWTHKVDDGLDTRKTAYETMYTLVRLYLLLSSSQLTSIPSPA